MRYCYCYVISFRLIFYETRDSLNKSTFLLDIVEICQLSGDKESKGKTDGYQFWDYLEKTPNMTNKKENIPIHVSNKQFCSASFKWQNNSGKLKTTVDKMFWIDKKDEEID